MKEACMLDLLYKRRSIRNFTDRAIEEEKIEQLTRALLLAPSSRGIRPWEFVLVTDREMLRKLAQAREHGSGFLEGAPLGIVVAADPSASDVWIEDASIACITVQLAAESLGLGSCWIQIRNREHDPDMPAGRYVGGLLGIPDEYEVEAVIAVGYPGEIKPGRTDADLTFDKLHRERFSR
jgi:nitroreductase